MKNQYRGSQNIISEKKVSLDKGVYRGARHNGFKFEELNSDQNHKKIYRLLISSKEKKRRKHLLQVKYQTIILEYLAKSKLS